MVPDSIYNNLKWLKNRKTYLRKYVLFRHNYSVHEARLLETFLFEVFIIRIQDIKRLKLDPERYKWQQSATLANNYFYVRPYLGNIFLIELYSVQYRLVIKYTGINVTWKIRRHRYFIYVLLLTQNFQCSEKEKNPFTGIMLKADDYYFFI